MNGSEKQIKWAEEIKANINVEKFLGKGKDENGNEIIRKAVEFVNSIEDARFWIDYRNKSAMQILTALMESGLQVKGFDFETRIKMTTDGKFENNDLSL